MGTKAISIIGAGSGNTIIINNVGTLVEFARTGTSLIARLSGFSFNSNYTQEPVISLVGPISKIRIDHCAFNKGGTVIMSNNLGKNADGPVYGVVDHCQFINIGGQHGAYFAVDVRRGETHLGETAWNEWQASPNIAGSSKMLYFEDCTFLYDSGMSTVPGGCDMTFYGQYGGRACVRHSTFTGYPLGYFDAHGDSPEFSTLYYEIYNNTFAFGNNGCPPGAAQGKFMYLRGGMHVIHDNTFTNDVTPINLEVYWTSDIHIINNTYIWGNRWGSDTNQSDLVEITDSGQTYPGYSATRIILNQNYFLHAPQTGQTFYPYTPLTYPHPLIPTGTPSPTPTATATATGTPIPTPSPSPTPTATPLGLSFPAPAGIITDPFVISGSNVSQPIDTDDPTQGGRAFYAFNVPVSGDYQLAALVNCPDGGSNSVFLNVDAEPSSSMIWSITPTSGFELRIASWYPSTTPQVWTLNAGVHQLIVRGREANTLLQRFTFSIPPQPPQGLHVVP